MMIHNSLNSKNNCLNGHNNGVVALDGLQLVFLRLVSSLKDLGMIIRFANIT
uniref:Uncharacterized protein n=1 Tax=Lepeophtheirus salmonis TaxID=72036 RepID=A0A0K2UXH6_LEPSM